MHGLRSHRRQGARARSAPSPVPTPGTAVARLFGRTVIGADLVNAPPLRMRRTGAAFAHKTDDATCLKVVLVHDAGRIAGVNLRRLGRTGSESVGDRLRRLGIGGENWIGAAGRESLRALHRTIDLGVNFIDTALEYGWGHSERLVGSGSRTVRARCTWPRRCRPGTSSGRAHPGVHADEAFPGDHVRRVVDRSLTNLGLDVVDLLQLHVWSDEWVGQGDWLETVEALRATGKIRAFGVSINDYQPSNAIAAIETGAVDTVQVVYDVFEQAPEDQLLGRCAELGVGVIAARAVRRGRPRRRPSGRRRVPARRLPRRVLRGRSERDVAERARRSSTRSAGRSTELPGSRCASCSAGRRSRRSSPDALGAQRRPERGGRRRRGLRTTTCSGWGAPLGPCQPQRSRDRRHGALTPPRSPWSRPGSSRCLGRPVASSSTSDSVRRHVVVRVRRHRSQAARVQPDRGRIPLDLMVCELWRPASSASTSRTCARRRDLRARSRPCARRHRPPRPRWSRHGLGTSSPQEAGVPLLATAVHPAARPHPGSTSSTDVTATRRRRSPRESSRWRPTASAR